MAKVQFSSEGQRLLHVSGVSQSEVAKRLGVGRSAVCEWFSGRKKPGESHRATLASWLGIPTGAWAPSYRRAVAACLAPEVPPADAPPAPEVPPADAPPAPEASLTRSSEPYEAKHDSLRDLRALILETRNRLRAMPNESKGAAPLTNTLARLLVREQEVLAALAATESNFARSPEHREFVTGVRAAIKPYPEAYAAFLAYLEPFEGDPRNDEI